MRAALAATLVSLLPMQGEKVVPVHEEPRHRLVFDSPNTRILDVQIVPGDTTLYHTHSHPILYVTISTSKTSSQPFNAPGAPDAPDAPSAPSGSPPIAPSSPAGRLSSVTSYFERPQTHRVTNLGPSLFRLIGVTNASLGNEATDPSPGFEGTPELTNRWFRGYRLALGETVIAQHRHPNPVAIIAVSGGAVLQMDGSPKPHALAHPGAFAFVEAGVAHTLRATAPDSQVQEIEIRRPR
jgi:quercetin dioxygenase-like cupin family protein